MAPLSIISILVCLLLLAFYLQSSSAYTWKVDRVMNFPRQSEEKDGDGKQFIRWGKFEGDEGRLLSCPSGYAFNAGQMKCTRREDVAGGGGQERQIESCPPDVVGPWPYDLDCSRFINCWRGVGLLMRCDQGLMFDNSTKRCNWPELAGCCEHWENE